MGENNIQTSATDAKSNFGKKGWLMVLYLFLGFFVITSLTTDLLNSILPALITERGFDPVAVWGTVTTASVIVCFIVIVLSILVKKTGARALAIVCLIIAFVSLCLWPLINSPTMLLVLRTVTLGVLSGNAYVANSSFTANWFPKKKGLVMGWATMGATTSTIAAVPLFTVLHNKIGFAAPFFVWAAIALVMLLMTIFFVRNNPEEKGFNPDNDPNMTPEVAKKLLEEGLEYAKTSKWTLKKMLTTRYMYLIGFGTGSLLLFSVGVMSNFINRALEMGLTQNSAILLMSVTALFGLAGSYICGFLDAKFGTKKASILLYIWIIIGLALNIAASFVGLGLFYVSIFMLTAAIGGANNFSISMIATVFGRYDFSSAYQTTWPLVQIIATFGYTLVGGLAARMGGTFNIAFALLIVCCAASAIITAFIPNKPVGR